MKTLSADIFYDTSYKNKTDRNFYRQCMQRYPHDNVLEIGSGTGRILFDIAKSGTKIDGIEPNYSRFCIAKEKLKKSADNIKNNVGLYNCDLEHFATLHKYSMIIMPFRVLQEFASADEQEQALKKLKTFLKPGGLLIFDVINPNVKMLSLKPSAHKIMKTKQYQKGGKTFVKESVLKKIDVKNQIMSCEQVYYFTEGANTKKVFKYKYKSRYLFYAELVNLVRFLNYQIVDVFGSFTFKEFDKLGKPKNIIMVLKNKE